jgi:YfiR/HmsC-like
MRVGGAKTYARRSLSRRCVCFLLLSSLLCFSALQGFGQQRPTEAQVKAAYLYNFGKFVTWPPDQTDNSDSLAICILGKDPFGAVLDTTVAGENINGKKITVKRLAKLQDGGPCQILYISISEQVRVRQILPMARRAGMLTVSDIPSFAQLGGIIGFVTLEDKIRFEVNRDAAERSGLALSSQLLKVASRVIGQTPGADEP